MDEEIEKMFSTIVSKLETEEKLKQDQERADQQSVDLEKTPVEAIMQDIVWRWVHSNDGAKVIDNSLRNALQVMLRDKTSPLMSNIMHQEIQKAVHDLVAYYVQDTYIENIIKEYIYKEVDLKVPNISNIDEDSVKENLNSVISLHVQSQLDSSTIKSITEQAVQNIINKKFGV